MQSLRHNNDVELTDLFTQAKISSAVTCLCKEPQLLKLLLNISQVTFPPNLISHKPYKTT